MRVRDVSFVCACACVKVLHKSARVHVCDSFVCACACVSFVCDKV